MTAQTLPRTWSRRLDPLTFAVALLTMATLQAAPATEPTKPDATATKDDGGSAGDGLGTPDVTEIHIEGIVIDETGAAVPDARIEWWPVGTARRETIPADGEGKFRLTAPRGGKTIRLQATDAEGQRLGAVSIGQVATGAARRLDGPVRIVVKPAREIVVHVTDADRNPVEGASTEAWGHLSAEDHTAFWSDSATTGVDGAARLLLPQSGSVSEVIALKPGVGFAHLDREERRSRLSVEELLSEFTLRLRGAQTVRVRLVDDRGQPVPNAYAYPFLVKQKGAWRPANVSGSRAVKATTDGEGIATFDWLPAELDGDVTFQGGRSREFHQSFPAVFKPAEGNEVTVRLGRRVPVSGRVIDADGHPVAGISVLADGTSIGFYDDRQQARTDADGAFEMRLAPDSAYMIAVTDDARASNFQLAVVRPGKAVTGLELVLVEPAIVRGRVTLGPDQQPVEGESLSLRLEGGRLPDELNRLVNDNRSRHIWLYRPTTTDAEGRYEFRVGPGEYTLWGPDRTEPRRLVIAKGRELVENFHQDKPATMPLEGLVFGPDGRPVGGAAVSGRYLSADGFVREARTNPDGRFKAERSPDSLVLLARSDDGRLGEVIRLGNHETTVRIELHPTATATGRLLSDTGKPLAGGEVTHTLRLDPEDREFGRWNYGDGFGGTLRTDGQGRFEVGGLVVGEVYWFSFKVDENGSTSYKSLAIERSGAISIGDIEIPAKAAAGN